MFDVQIIKEIYFNKRKNTQKQCLKNLYFSVLSQKDLIS